MTATDFLCLAPLMIVAAAPVVIMLTLTIVRNYRVIYGISLFMFAVAFASLFFMTHLLPHHTGELLVFDRFSVLFLAIILISALVITVFSYLYFTHHGDHKEEYFIVLFIATLGASILVLAEHFITLFLGLETLSISLYIMIAYIKYRDYSVEAGVKFLVIASVATAFLLFGMALIYAVTGSMSFSGVAGAFSMKPISPLLLVGTGMMLAGIGFKLALVPFHMWAPDVYQGSPAPVTSFIATISKGAILALSLRFFIAIRGFENDTIFTITALIAILSMFAGNLLALRQSNLKRLLAYSSIAHMGYLLITLLTGTQNGIQSAVFYLISYIITTLAAFGVISLLSSHKCDCEDINDLKGLFYLNPWMAVVLSLTMFSLAGIPLTAGFIAKFYIVLEGIRSDLWILVFSLIINTVISLYYYLSVIKTMFTRSDNIAYKDLTVSGNIVLAILAFGILLLGILPSFLAGFLKGITI